MSTRAAGWRWRTLRRTLITPGARCVDCGSATDLQLDHEIPRARGGRDTRANAAIRCADCNRRKSDHPVVIVQPELGL